MRLIDVAGLNHRPIVYPSKSNDYDKSFINGLNQRLFDIGKYNLVCDTEEMAAILYEHAEEYFWGDDVPKHIKELYLKRAERLAKKMPQWLRAAESK